MAERTPLYMDINNVYSGDEMGLPHRDFISEGIVLGTDMAVSAGAGNTINISAGAAWVVGDTDAVNQPTYRIINDATVNLGINPDPTNPRQIRVGMQINDAGFSGVLRNGVLTAIHGTPAGAPAIPAEPASFMTLATILVPAAAASSAAYTFTDLRVRARMGGQALLTPSARMYRGAALNIAAGAAFTTIPWDNESWDDLNYHDNVTNPSRVTIPVTGTYEIYARCTLQNAAGYRQIRFLLNGAAYSQAFQTVDTVTDTTLQITDFGRFTTGDYIETQVAQSSAGVVPVDIGSPAGTICLVKKIG